MFGGNKRAPQPLTAGLAAQGSHGFVEIVRGADFFRWMLADCASEIYKARLMLLHIAYKAENGMDLRNENGIAKVFLANMVHQVVDTALQLHGALGYSHDTPLARWYTGIRSQRLVDGPDEVHRWRTGANVIKAFEKYGTTASVCGGELFD